ncbi:MAG: PDZ domain-containing protein [Bacteroidales bacterium]|jgi:carboxyl-terminal processing protease|nr:PDZ domain-containing protein [Bacteroidales bacterium]
MNSKAKILTIVIISLLVGIAIGMFEMPNHGIITTKNSSEKASKLSDILQLISDDYVDAVNLDTLTDEAIKSLLAQLDPHSVYLTAAEVKSENEHLNGNFEGIGIQFRIVEDTIVVIQPIKGGPSNRVGIMAGDRIVRINDTLRVGKELETEQVMRLLKGKKGSKVKLSIKRNGLERLVDFTVTRDVIETHSVDFYGMIDKTTGYIKLSQFSSTSYKEVVQALSALKYDHDMQQLIFDLRGNGGGYLNEAIAIADEFLPKGDLIVFTKGRPNSKPNKSFATKGGLFEKGKLIILIDEVSASASEILAGAVQDNDRGMIIGRRTFGKGLVQDQISLSDGSALRLTIARYYTPSGRCIQRPYVSNDPEQYYMDFIARYANMETNSDTIPHADSLRYKTKNGRYVFGGGGIEPDIELPYSAYKRSETCIKLLRLGLTYQFCFDFADTFRETLNQFSDGDDFLANFQVSNTIWQSFNEFAAKHNVKIKSLSAKEQAQVRTMIKAYIAQLIFDDQSFYRLFITVDEDVQTAIQYFK